MSLAMMSRQNEKIKFENKQSIFISRPQPNDWNKKELSTLSNWLNSVQIKWNKDFSIFLFRKLFGRIIQYTCIISSVVSVCMPTKVGFLYELIIIRVHFIFYWFHVSHCVTLLSHNAPLCISQNHDVLLTITRDHSASYSLTRAYMQQCEIIFIWL